MDIPKPPVILSKEDAHSKCQTHRKTVPLRGTIPIFSAPSGISCDETGCHAVKQEKAYFLLHVLKGPTSMCTHVGYVPTPP